MAAVLGQVAMKVPRACYENTCPRLTAMRQWAKQCFRKLFPRPELALLEQLRKRRLGTEPCSFKLPSGRLMRGLKPLEAYHEYKDIFIKGIYDADLSSRRPRVIDAGAYMGLSAVYFLQRYPDCDLTLFECDPEVISTLTSNLPEVESGQVRLEPFALSSGRGRANFFRRGGDAGSLMRQDGEPFEVECRPLMDYLEEEVDFLKMNIEGAEIDVLASCGASLRRVKEMVVEFHSFAGQSQRLDELLKTLRDFGFRYCINHFDEESNWACRTPFRTDSETSYVLLVHAKRQD